MELLHPGIAKLLILLGLGAGLGTALANEQERIAESILPALAYGPSCSSSVELRNLGARAVILEVEGHRSSGALVPLAGLPRSPMMLKAGQRVAFRMEIEEETTGAWAKIRERVPSAQLSPVVAVSATTECLVENQLRTVRRDVAFATRNPWFSSDIGQLHGGMVSFINTTERVAKVVACYSTGGLYAVPGASVRNSELQPICDMAFDVQVPPFGSREFPVEREDSSYFSLKTAGDAIVLEMLRPIAANVRVYAVDSSIHFEGEIAPPRQP